MLPIRKSHIYTCIIAAAFSGAVHSGQWTISSPVSVKWNTSDNSLFLKNSAPKQAETQTVKAIPTSDTIVKRSGINTGDLNDPFDQFEDADDYYAFLEEFKNVTGWVKPKYDKGNHDKTDSIIGFSTETAGFSIGATSELNHKTQVGTVFTYDKTKVKGDDNEELSFNTMLGSFYTQWSDRKYFLNTHFAIGSSRADRDRRVEGVNYKAKFNIRTFAANLTTGKHFRHRGWNIDPNIVVNYSVVSFDNHTETSDTNMKNSITLTDFETTELGIGIKIDRSYWGKSLVRRGRYQPEFSLTGYYDASNDSTPIRARVSTGEDSFVVTGPKKDRFRIEGKMGLTITSYRRLKFNTSYRFNRSSNYLSHGVSASVKYQF